MKLLLILVLLAIAGAMLYVRLSPLDIARFHKSEPSPEPVGDWTGENSHMSARVFEAGPGEVLSRLDRIALATPGTERVAGSPGEGLVTWVTRSAVWGFPDFTTASAVERPGGTRLVVHGRARFGRSDLGVNRARVGDWIGRLESGEPGDDT